MIKTQTSLFKKNTGFTFIEIMITVSLLTFLLFMGGHLTRAWIDRSQVNNTMNTLKNAIAQAKIAALRNTYNLPLAQPSTHVCLDQSVQQLYVIRANQYSANGCDINSSNNTILSHFDIANHIDIQHKNNPFTCLTFNAAGFLVTSSSLTSCSTDVDLSFKVEKNNETANFKIM